MGLNHAERSQAVLDKQVQVETLRNDKYGRVVGKVVLDGQDINLKQLQLGMAWVYREYLKELSKVDKALYLEAEAQSKTIPAGLWQYLNSTEPWIWRKIKNFNHLQLEVNTLNIF